MTTVPWYRCGLGFECTRCGRCCSGGTGYVWLTAEDVDALTAHIGLSGDELGRRYVRAVGGRYALLERAGGECIFLRDNLCSIYEARPRQCRSFPFWPANLASPAAWQRAAASCEGIRPDAPSVALDVIEGAMVGGPK